MCRLLHKCYVRIEITMMWQPKVTVCNNLLLYLRVFSLATPNWHINWWSWIDFTVSTLLLQWCGEIMCCVAHVEISEELYILWPIQICIHCVCICISTYCNNNYKCSEMSVHLHNSIVLWWLIHVLYAIYSAWAPCNKSYTPSQPCLWLTSVWGEHKYQEQDNSGRSKRW